MPRNKKQRDLIPRHFQSVAEAAEFWDNHDLTDYWDQTRDVKIEVDIQRRVFLAALEPELAKKLVSCARKQGVSTETLINLWLTEKVATASQSK
jgi:CopG antitoxin of type II toxin-antitoxin system